MPFEVIESVDELTSGVRIRKSAIYELIFSIRALFKPSKWHEQWAEHARATLDPDLYQSLQIWQAPDYASAFLELPVDYPDQEDVEGFFNYVAKLSDAEYLHYVVGRTIPRADITKMLKQANPLSALTYSLLENYPKHFQNYAQLLEHILPHLKEFRQQTLQAWKAYWHTFFRDELPAFDSAIQAGLQEKQAILAREGGRAMFEKVTGRDHMPTELPVGVPYTSLTFIPVYMLPSRVYQFFGYGNVTILFDPQFTEERHQTLLQTAQSELGAVFKALDDETRLKILRMIAQRGNRHHGKSIAEQLDISASAVSRHLALLKDAKLVSEVPQKNQITYQFQKETLMGLVDKLLDYLCN